MSLSHAPSTLRGKLAVWLTVVLVAALALYSGVAYVSLRQVLWYELDERLHNDIETLEGLLQPFWTPQGVRASYDRPVLDEDDAGGCRCGVLMVACCLHPMSRQQTRWQHWCTRHRTGLSR